VSSPDLCSGGCVIPFVNQLLAHGRWFSLGTPASSTTATGRYDIAEILLKVTLNTKIQIQIPHKTSLTQPFLL
jgi:hypothetical protein